MQVPSYISSNKALQSMKDDIYLIFLIKQLVRHFLIIQDENRMLSLQFYGRVKEVLRFHRTHFPDRWEYYLESLALLSSQLTKQRLVRQSVFRSHVSFQ